MKQLLIFSLIVCLGLQSVFAAMPPHIIPAHSPQNNFFLGQALALSVENVLHPLFRRSMPTQKLRHEWGTKTIGTSQPIAGVMGLTKYLLPRLRIRRLAFVEGLMISMFSFSSVAFFLMRHPLLFEQNMPTGVFKLSGLFFTSPPAGFILGGLVLAYFVTGVVHSDGSSAVRWNIPQTLRATGVAVVGGLVSFVFMTVGALRPNLFGLSVIASGLLLGPWVRAQFHSHKDPAVPPSPIVSSKRKFLQSLGYLAAGVPFLGLGTMDAFSALILTDNRRFLMDEENHVRDYRLSEGAGNDPSLRAAHLPSGLSIRYRVMNPNGKNLVLVFHGWLESLEEFSPAIEPTLMESDMQGIFIDRPGIGPVSTLIPGLDFAAWPHLVKEFVEIEFNNRPFSIVGHSAGGLWALACALIPNVQAMALICSITPRTFGSLARTLFHGAAYNPAELGVGLLPHTLIPVAQQICDSILHDWTNYFKRMVNDLGPTDEVFLTQYEDLVKKNMRNSIAQGAKALIEDVRSFGSPWPYRPEDSAHIPILSFNGTGDQMVPSTVADEFHAHVVTHARRYTIPGMGHLPSPAQYAHIFAQLGTLHAEKSLAGAA